MVFAIIQARMGSNRLPGKVMMNLIDKPVIDHVYSRVKISKNIKEVIIATSINSENNELIKYLDIKGYKYYRGAENDVLSRFTEIIGYSKLNLEDSIVRITADCPLIDYEIIDSVIEKHLDKNVDYTSNTIERTFPDGLDCEVIKVKTLKSLEYFSLNESHKEHVTSYITENKSKFNIETINNHIDYSHFRWTLDYLEDYQYITWLYEKLYSTNNYFGYKEIIEFLSKEGRLDS